MSEDLSMDKAIFFPYYVNQPRLLDVFAILNGGFSEYEELQTCEASTTKKTASAKAEAGFTLFRLGAGAEYAKENLGMDEGRFAERKVHTTTSMLKLVLDELDGRGYLREIKSAKPGDFVVVPVCLRINSIKSLIDEAIELAELGDKLKNLNGESGTRKSNTDTAKADISKLKKIGNAVRELFESEEMVSTDKEYAIVANIDDRHLYQSSRQDLVDGQLMCLGQVRRVHSKGAKLLRNTVYTKFAKMHGSEASQAIIDSLTSLTSSVGYSFGSDVITEIEEKPVYEMEIVALFQDTYPIDSTTA